MASVEELLRTADELPPPELERFVLGVLALRSRRKNGLATKEADLLVRINQPFPPQVQEQFQELITKRDSQTLTDKEHGQLLSLTDTMEQFEAEWVTSLSKLASIRRVDMDTLMDQLGLSKRTYV